VLLILASEYIKASCEYWEILSTSLNFFCVCVVYSGEYDVCDVTLSVHPHRAS
jgi:hypothetical protein